jgi:alpha-L-rhamnosidase
VKKVVLLVLAVIALSCSNNPKLPKDADTIWANAQWIAFEQLEDSMKVVPAVHGSGNDLGELCVKRSIVPMFRKDLRITKEIANASINISGLGHYELFINGEKIGDRFLSPGWSFYQKRALYNNYDIKKQLNSGDNALGVLVGNGFYNINRERYRKLVVAYGYPKLKFNVKIEYTDGTTENIISDASCTVNPSAITYSSIFGGEDYDATHEAEGWNTSEFDDSNWSSPVIIHDPAIALDLEADHSLKVMQTFKPMTIFSSKSGRTIYDFGQNASGIISLKVKGNRGAQIRIRPDELVNNQGDITQKSGGGPYEFNYTLKGDSVEVWQPRFTYYGFRYADVEIIESKDAVEKTKILELHMLHTRNSSPTVGSFACSDTLFNRIFDLINWGIKSNMASVATDCPHREKLGWLEQTYLIGPSMHYNFDIHKLYRKIVTDMMDSQLENGLVPDIAPEYVPFGGGFRDSPEWGSASVFIPWQLYKWYGDKDVLKTAYPMMKRYVDYLGEKANNNILEYGLGDWYDLGPKHPGEAQLTPKAVTATSIYYYDLKLVAMAAKLLGHNRDIKKYDDIAANVKSSFLEKYYNPETGVCSTASQTAYAMPLYTGILPESDKELVLSNLVESIKENDYALTSGDVGYHFLVRVLSENGFSDVLYKMNNRSDRPGYGYQLKMGATSLTESWAALADVSNNHMMLGHLMEWFYAGLGGIYQDKNSIAYENIIIAPKPVGDIKWVKCSYNSTKGTISSEWGIEENTFTLDIEVPNKASAKVVVPVEYKSIIKVIDLASQREKRIDKNESDLELEAGTYRIIARK